MTNGEIKQEVTFLLGSGFSSIQPYSIRSTVRNVIKIPSIVEGSGVNDQSVLDVDLM